MAEPGRALPLREVAFVLGLNIPVLRSFPGELACVASLGLAVPNQGLFPTLVALDRCSYMLGAGSAGKGLRKALKGTPASSQL